MTITALLVIVLASTIPMVQEIGGSDLAERLGLAGAVDFSTADVLVADPTLIQNVGKREQHQERTALGRSLKC